MSHDAKDFCRKYQLRATAWFTLRKYTECVAAILASYWESKMQHLFDIYKYWDDESHEFTPVEVDDFVEPDDFAGLAATADRVVKQHIDQLRSVAPQLPLLS